VVIPGELLSMVVVSLGAEEATMPPPLMARLVVCECSLLSCASYSQYVTDLNQMQPARPLRSGLS
jgi:hypothetical protein